MKPYREGSTLWIPLSLVAREFSKHPFTLRRWCDSGFILTLGYRTRRDAKGHWFLASMNEKTRPVNYPAELRVP